MTKAVFGLCSGIKVSQLNRLLRPFNVRLVVKSSKEWGSQVAVTAQALEPLSAPPAPPAASPADA